jgi:hypothetical protein
MMQEESADVSPPRGVRIRSDILARMAGVPFRAPPPPLTPPTKPASESFGYTDRRSTDRQTAMDYCRNTLPVIVYPAPEAIPEAATVCASLAPDVRTLCLTALANPNQAATAVRALAALVRPASAAKPIDLAAMIEAGEPADSDVHDAFFNIARSSHDHPAQILISVFQSRSALWDDLAETPSSLPDADLAIIDHGLSATLAALLSTAPPVAAPPSGPSAVRIGRRQDCILRRWMRGHQIFTALSQGLIVAVKALEAATTAQDIAARAGAADLMATAMEACGRALEFTGDFRVEVYEELIRPSMSPPHQPEGFSGLLSSDHRELVFRLKAARPAIDRLRAEDPERHTKVVDALTGVYDRHKHVCAKFVGTQRASLLMAEERGRSGVDQLERFKINRLRQLGPKVSEHAN